MTRTGRNLYLEAADTPRIAMYMAFSKSMHTMGENPRHSSVLCTYPASVVSYGTPPHGTRRSSLIRSFSAPPGAHLRDCRHLPIRRSNLVSRSIVRMLWLNRSGCQASIHGCDWFCNPLSVQCFLFRGVNKDLQDATEARLEPFITLHRNESFLPDTTRSIEVTT